MDTMTGARAAAIVCEPVLTAAGRGRARHPPAPLVLPALGFMGGIVFDDALPATPTFYISGTVLAGLLLCWPFARHNALRVIVALLAFTAGGLSHTCALRRQTADAITGCARTEPALMRLTGHVVSPPRWMPKPSHLFAPWWPTPERTTFLLDVDTLEASDGPHPVRGLVKAVVKEPVLGLAVGDRVELFGWGYRPGPPANPGQFDWGRYERRRGVSAGITCERRECVHKCAGAGPTALTLWDRLRQRTRALLLDDISADSAPEATLLDTMVLGSRSAIDPRLNDAFMRIGCTHYLAVSGSNIGMIAVFVFLVGRTLRVGVRGCAGAVVLVSVLYCLIAEPRPPIVRATIMSIAVCVGLVLGRPANFLNGLSLAALVILAVRPTHLHDLDFQLSFSALLALVYLSPPLVNIARHWRPSVLPGPSDGAAELLVRAAPPTVLRRALQGLEARFWWMLWASVAAWLASVPITLYYFDRFSLWGWLSTLVLFPFVFAVTVLSFAKLLVALLWPTLALVLTVPLQWLTSLLIRVVEILEQLPELPVGVAAPPWWVAALVVAAVMAWAAREHWPVARRTWPLATGTAALGVLCWLAPPQGDGHLRMTVLSVGRGAAVVFELPDGRHLVCDAGTSAAFDPGATTLVPFLRQRGARRIDALLISHPNLDHFSGVPTLLEHFPAGPVYLTPYFEPLSAGGEPGRALLDDLRARRHPVQILDRNVAPFTLGGATFEVLWPPADLGLQTADNDTSLVVRVRYAGHTALVTGDIEAMAQARLLGDARLRADVLVLPHHGSPRHNTRDFVEAVQPAVLISSTSARDTRADPELAAVLGDRQYFCTADDGAITVTIDPSGVEVSAFRGGS